MFKTRILLVGNSTVEKKKDTREQIKKKKNF